MSSAWFLLQNVYSVRRTLYLGYKTIRFFYKASFGYKAKIRENMFVGFVSDVDCNDISSRISTSTVYVGIKANTFGYILPAFTLIMN